MSHTSTATASAKRSSRSQKKRAAILAAATDAFRDVGFHHTSMDQVAAAANVSKRTVYNHFPSKDALIAAVLEGVFSNPHRRALRYDPSRNLAEQLCDFARDKMRSEVTEEFLGLFRAMVGDFARSPEQITKIVPNILLNEAQLLTWLLAAKRDGRLELSNPARATLQFYALLKGTMFYPVLLGLRPLPSEAECDIEIAEAVAMFLARYEASPNAERAPS